MIVSVIFLISAQLYWKNLTLYKRRTTNDADAAIWHITESIDNLKELFRTGNSTEIPPAFGHVRREYEWFASRILLNILAGTGRVRYRQDGGPVFIRPGALPLFCSISHSQDWIAAAISHQGPIGVDIQTPAEKVHNVAKRFLSPLEWESFEKDTPTMSLLWSIKESVYKWFGSGGLIFNRDIIVEPFDLQREGVATVRFKPLDLPLSVLYHLNEHYVHTLCNNH